MTTKKTSVQTVLYLNKQRETVQKVFLSLYYLFYSYHSKSCDFPQSGTKILIFFSPISVAPFFTKKLQQNKANTCEIIQMSHDMRFPTMWYVRLA